LNQDQSLDILEQAKKFALQAHGEQKYGNFPYGYHLNKVYEVLKRFHFSEEKLLCAAYLHDVLEDTETSYEELTTKFGIEIAKLCDAVTLPKNLDREAGYREVAKKIAACPGAEILKLADRTANVEACLKNKNNHKLKKYQSEHAQFQKMIPVNDRTQKMLDYLNQLILLNEYPKEYSWEFFCNVCQKSAATLKLIPPNSILPEAFHSTTDWTWRIENFIGNSSIRLDEETANKALSIMESGKIKHLSGKTSWYDWAPFFCRDCEVSYCSDHWQKEVRFDDGFYDDTRGTCPKGHQCLLDD
jgi:hypothetical protein